ncbi:MAG: aconitate hydratase, partial [Acidobacteriota bacterium]|nr:aconitate hydratase [Acidobacteriota bacterium]
TTCIGNSGPLQPEISKSIADNDLVATAVLSGNRNFEGRISPDVRANYLASPPLVVAYALAGDMNIDLTTEPLGTSKDGKPVYLKDIWPTQKEIADLVHKTVTREAFQKKYADVFKGDEKWQSVETTDSLTYDWPSTSTYVRNPPYFQDMSKDPGKIEDISGARVLAVLGDMITTDHISPAGSFKPSTPAGKYLTDRQVPVSEFNSYGSRRGNHEVMMRGTFANIRLRNLLAPGTEGGVTRHLPDGEQMSIYDAAMKYIEEDVPLIVLAGKEYGSGSSRDWAAKGTRLLGVRAVIAESFERIHRSNLVGMGVLPLQFADGESVASLGLTGQETFAIAGIAGDGDIPRELTVTADDRKFTVTVRIDTPKEQTYFRHGGILQFVLRQLLAS